MERESFATTVTTGPASADSLPTPFDDAALVRSGAESVELVERFYGGVFAAAIAFVCLASIAALALLPTRNSVVSHGPPVTIVLTALLVAASPVGIWRATALYRGMRRTPTSELAVLVVAAALLSYPLRSELWWPSCGLLMLLTVIAPLPRALAYCLAALLANLAAHVVAGDLTTAPPVTIIGLWIGMVFWTATFGLITDCLAQAVLRPRGPVLSATASDPVRVTAWVEREDEQTTRDAGGGLPRSDARSGESTGVEIERLTARQLEIVALLADGLRYRDIAACLSISERQVQRHISNAVARSQAGSVEQLVAHAVKSGVVRAAPSA